MQKQGVVRSRLVRFAMISTVMVWFGACTEKPVGEKAALPGSAITPRLLTGAVPSVSVGAVLTDQGCQTNAFGPSDDDSMGPVNLPFTVNFFGTPYSSFYLNNNGNITFTGAMGTFTPFPIDAETPPMIAGFLADVDTGGAGSAVVHYGETTYDGRPAACINWVNVGYYREHADKLNSFQIVLVDRSDIGASGDVDIMLNYDRIVWETGDDSGGTDGLGGTSAAAGYSDGSGNPDHFFSFPGSLVNGGLLDSNAEIGLITHSHNSSILGRYIFPVRSGQTSPGCQCIGSGPNGPVTVFCGESACGEDYTIYACGSSGWSQTGQPCDVPDAGVTPDSGLCQCQGTGPGGSPVTAACGESACGSDYMMYSCSAAGWSLPGGSCTDAGSIGGPDAGVDAGSGSCQCSGTGPGGVPVTAPCGQSACGSDSNMYSCSASGWSPTGQSCCSCEGTGPGGVPVTVNCGQSACGEDSNMYSCSASGWSPTGQSCCSCEGTGPGGVPVTVNCGQSACGEDFTSYSCTSSGWSWTGQSCNCTCNGIGPGDVPVSVYCGQSACGSDYTIYSCSTAGWAWTGQSCAGSDAGVPASPDAG